MYRSKLALVISITILAATTISCKKEIQKQIEEHEKTQPHNSSKTTVVTLPLDDLIFDNGYYTIEKEVNILTKPILQTGSVNCHIKYDDNYLPMPVTLYVNNAIEAYFTYSLNKIKFYLAGDIIGGNDIEVKVTVQP